MKVNYSKSIKKIRLLEETLSIMDVDSSEYAVLVDLIKSFKSELAQAYPLSTINESDIIFGNKLLKIRKGKNSIKLCLKKNYNGKMLIEHIGRSIFSGFKLGFIYEGSVINLELVSKEWVGSKLVASINSVIKEIEDNLVSRDNMLAFEENANALFEPILPLTKGEKDFLVNACYSECIRFYTLGMMKYGLIADYEEESDLEADASTVMTRLLDSFDRQYFGLTTPFDSRLLNCFKQYFYEKVDFILLNSRAERKKQQLSCQTVFDWFSLTK